MQEVKLQHRKSSNNFLEMKEICVWNGELFHLLPCAFREYEERKSDTDGETAHVLRKKCLKLPADLGLCFLA